MSSWSIVALAAVICSTVTLCWGLWLSAVYTKAITLEQMEQGEREDIENTMIHPSEQATGTWPKPNDPAEGTLG
jgi:hypothetical protein